MTRNISFFRNILLGHTPGGKKYVFFPVSVQNLELKFSENFLSNISITLSVQIKLM